MKKEFTITGFTWASCALTAQTALSRLDGVKEVTVEPSGAAVIIYDSNKVDIEQMKKVLAEFKYSIKE